MSFTHIDYTIDPDSARAYIAKRKDDALRLALDLLSGTVLYVKFTATPQGVTLDFPGHSVQCTNAECAIALILQRWWQSHATSPRGLLGDFAFVYRRIL